MKRFDVRAVRPSRGHLDKGQVDEKRSRNLEERLWEESADAPSDLETVNVEDARGGEKRETGVTRCQIKKSSKGTLIPKLLVAVETMRMVSLGVRGEYGLWDRRM
jgi:hypothetical protein